MNSNIKETKALIVGLDGATFNIIHPLIQKRQLPFFQNLAQLGSYGQLKSTLPLNGAAAWASFFSGQNPGKHNVYDYLVFNKSSTHPKVIDNKSIKAPLIWDIANQHSLKTILMNIPIVSEPKPVDGIMISGMLTPEDKPYAYPDNIYQDLKKQDYRVDCGPARYYEREEYFKQIIETLEKQVSVFQQLIRNNPWDLAIVTFNAIQRAQQIFWEDEEKIAAIYILIDKSLQALYEAIDDETYFTVLSNHGYKSVNKKFFVNEWLWEQGLLGKKITTAKVRITNVDDVIYNHTSEKDPLITNLLTKTGLTKKNIRSVLPDPVSDLLKRAVPHSIKKIFHREYLDVEWHKTQAYFISEHLQGININLKGREPNGIVKPGSEYEQLRDKIISELFHLKDPYTFEHVVDDVFRKEDVLSGDYLEAAPDIIIIPKDYSYFLDPNKRTSHLCISSARDEYPVAGQQDGEGIFFITGPDIKQQKQASNIHINDVTPTILHLLGVENSANFDGKVMSQIFTELHIENEIARPVFLPAEDTSSFILDNFFNKTPPVPTVAR